MPEFEYKVVPAPTKGEKAKGVKTPQARFAHALETMMNTMAADGWEYLRADMLPSEERQGLTGSTTNWRNMLVFRREKPGSLETFHPRFVDIAAKTDPEPSPEPPTEEVRKDPPPLRPASGAERMLKDNGVEELSEVSGMTAALRARANASGGNPPPIDGTPEPRD